MNRFTKKVIFYQVGASGHFLAEFLTTGGISILPNHRIDFNQRLSSRFVDETCVEHQFKGGCSDHCINAVKEAIDSVDQRVILSHCDAVSAFQQFTDRAWIRKILPNTNLFGWIKNAVYKTHDISHVMTQKMSRQIDFFFTNVKWWVEIDSADQDRPTDMIIDFGNLYDVQYLTDLYKSVNGHDPNAAHVEFAEEYIRKQFPPMHDCSSCNMIDIIKHIKPQSSFDLATALFIYEKNHHSIDQNRQWHMDQFPDSIPQCIDFLITNSQKYKIFPKDANC